MAAKRPNLAVLADAAGSVRGGPRVQQAISQQDNAPAASIGQGATQPVAKSRVGKKPITGFYPESVRMQLKLMGVEQSRSIEDLMAEALNDLFAKYGRPEIAPRSR